jgi:hypothetical protein
VIRSLPGELNIEVGIGDFFILNFTLMSNGSPVDLRTTTLTIKGSEMRLVITDPLAGKGSIGFQKMSASSYNWALIRSSFPSKRLVSGVITFSENAGDSFGGKDITINLIDDESEVEIILNDTLPKGGAQGTVLSKKSNKDYDFEWTVLSSNALTVEDINTISKLNAIVADATLFALPSGGLDNNLLVKTGSSVSWSNSINVEYVAFTENGPANPVPRSLYWDDLDKSLAYRADNFNLDIGQENIAYVRNNSGNSIPAGMAVCITGVAANRLSVSPSNPTTQGSACKTLGITISEIPNNSFGYVSTFGVLRGINTNGFNDADELFISATPGVLSKTPPEKPSRQVSVGFVIDGGKVNGSIFVTIRRNERLSELSDVQLDNLVKGDMLYRSDSRWEKIPKGNEGDVLKMVNGIPTWTT